MVQFLRMGGTDICHELAENTTKLLKNEEKSQVLFVMAPNFTYYVPKGKRSSPKTYLTLNVHGSHSLLKPHCFTFKDWSVMNYDIIGGGLVFSKLNY